MEGEGSHTPQEVVERGWGSGWSGRKLLMAWGAPFCWLGGGGGGEGGGRGGRDGAGHCHED